MTLPTTNDTRRFRRIAVRILIDYVSDKNMCCDYATTMGAGGLFVETDDPPEIGHTLKMRFHLPNGEELHEIEGRVVWQSKLTSKDGQIHAPGFGVKFSEGPATAKLARELEDCY
jgi:Tfp pilus assembly protein PilZ